MSPRTLPAQVLALAWLLPLLARAGGYELVQQDAAAAGMASTGTARVGAAAAWFNPAALADDGGWRFGLGLTFALSRIEANAQTEAPDAPWQAYTQNGVTTPPYLHASYAQGSWATGLSVTVPFASRVRWPGDWPQRFEILSSEPQYFRIAPFFAWRFGILRVSAGPHVDLGTLRLEKATNHVAEEGRATMLLSGYGFGGHASLYIEAADWLAVGLSYKSRTTLPLSGDADFEVPEAFAPRFPDQQVSASVTLPDRLAVGLEGRLGSFTLAADLVLSLWSANRTLDIDFSDPATEDRHQVNLWHDSLALRLGAQWLALEDRLQLRCGFSWDGLTGAPPPAETLAPSSPDSVRLGFSGGLSVRVIDQLWLDAFYEFLWLLERDSTSLDAPLASYRGEANLVGLAVRFHFGGGGAAMDR